MNQKLNTGLLHGVVKSIIGLALIFAQIFDIAPILTILPPPIRNMFLLIIAPDPIIVIIGIVLMGIGIHTMIPAIRRQHRKKLKKTGRCIQLPIQSVKPGSSTINKQAAEFIICTETDPVTHTLRCYTSDQYYSPLTYMMSFGDIVPIYIDQNNPDKYYVDVENVKRISPPKSCCTNNNF